jgi:hypothetical protein
MALQLHTLKIIVENGGTLLNEELLALIKEVEDSRRVISVVLEACGGAMLQVDPGTLETVNKLDPADLIRKIADVVGVEA